MKILNITIDIQHINKRQQRQTSDENGDLKKLTCLKLDYNNDEALPTEIHNHAELLKLISEIYSSKRKVVKSKKSFYQMYKFSHRFLIFQGLYQIRTL